MYPSEAHRGVHARRSSTIARSPMLWLVGATLLLFALLASSANAAQAPVGRGTVSSFAILAGSTVTNTGPSTINGDLGLTPGSAVTGFPPATLNGAMHITDSVAGIAQNDLTTAYNDAAGRTPFTAIPADAGGLTVTPGAFRATSALGLTGTLTLNAQGNPNAVFIFQVPSSLITASGSAVSMINGAQACNVFWQIGTSATFGTGSSFVGDAMVLASASLNDSVTVNGRILARTGAVTLINDTISASRCAAGTVGGEGGPSGPGSNGSGSTGGHNGTAILGALPPSVGKIINGPNGPNDLCVDRSFTASVTGLKIAKVVFSVGHKVVGTRNKAPFKLVIKRYVGGVRVVKAKVTFTDGTKPATLRMSYRACGAATSAVPTSPTPFTG
jgi:hypothetical protein